MTDPQSHVAYGMSAVAACDHACLHSPETVMTRPLIQVGCRRPQVQTGASPFPANPDLVRSCRKKPALDWIDARIFCCGGATRYADYPTACNTLETAA